MLHSVPAGRDQAALFMSSMFSGTWSVLEANILIKSGQLPTCFRLIQLQLAYVNYLRIAALDVILIRGGGQKERLAALIGENLCLYR